MVTTRRIEIAVGVFVALGLAALFVLAMKVSGLGRFGEPEGYELVAYFDNIGSLTTKAPVKISGVRIGRVAGITYDSQAYQAQVTMRIYPQYDNLPRDSIANVYTAGLLGEQYIALEPGASEEVLGDDDQIRHTQSAVVLEEIIGQFLVNATSK